MNTQISVFATLAAFSVLVTTHSAKAAVKSCLELYGEETGAPVASSSTVATSGNDAYEYGPMRVIYKNKTIKADRTLKKQEVEEMLNDMGAPAKGTGSIYTDRDRIQWAINGKALIDHFKGTGGIIYYLFLKAASQHMLDAGGNLKSHLSIRPHGRIDENGLVVNDDWSGFIQLTMCFELAESQGQGQPLLGTYRYNVRTDVSRCGFKSITKSHINGDPVFLGSAVDLSGVGNLDEFNYKLQAKASEIGTDIGSCMPGFGGFYLRIGQILLDEGQGYRMLSSSGQDAHFFILNPSHGPCVDMLTVDDPKLGIQPSSQRPLYCLGRCTAPAMINSGL